MTLSNVMYFLFGACVAFIIMIIHDLLWIKRNKRKTKPPVDHPHNRADGINWNSVREVTYGCNENVHHVSLYQAQPYATMYNHDHVHVLETDKCIKNRYGPRC